MKITVIALALFSNSIAFASAGQDYRDNATIVAKALGLKAEPVQEMVIQLCGKQQFGALYSESKTGSLYFINYDELPGGESAPGTTVVRPQNLETCATLQTVL